MSQKEDEHLMSISHNFLRTNMEQKIKFSIKDFFWFGHIYWRNP